MNELLNCPFCGTALTGEIDDGCSFHTHQKNDCFFSEYEFDQISIERWNRRTSASIGEDNSAEFDGIKTPEFGGIGEDGLPDLPKALVLVESDDDHSWGEIQADAWALGWSKGLGLGAPLFTADQMRQYARDAVEADRRARSSAKSHAESPETRMDTSSHASAKSGEHSPQAAQGVKDHEIRELVNTLRDIAVQYHDTQQLRTRIHNVVLPAFKRAQLARRSQGEPVAAMTDKGRFVKWNQVYAQEPWVSSGYRPLVFADAAPPLSKAVLDESAEVQAFILQMRKQFIDADLRLCHDCPGVCWENSQTMKFWTLWKARAALDAPPLSSEPNRMETDGIGGSPSVSALSSEQQAQPETAGQAQNCRPIEKAQVMQVCWSCKRPYTKMARINAAGHCPHCGVEIKEPPCGS